MVIINTSREFLENFVSTYVENALWNAKWFKDHKISFSVLDYVTDNMTSSEMGMRMDHVHYLSHGIRVELGFVHYLLEFGYEKRDIKDGD